MTYKEAIDAIQLDGIEIIATLPRMYSFTEGLKKAEEALKRAEEYRWHDLRENPDDLPQHHDFVFVCIDDCGGKDYTATGYGSGSWDIMSRIIAWREIELFEEEE